MIVTTPIQFSSPIEFDKRGGREAALYHVHTLALLKEQFAFRLPATFETWYGAWSTWGRQSFFTVKTVNGFITGTKAYPKAVWIDGLSIWWVTDEFLVAKFDGVLVPTLVAETLVAYGYDQAIALLLAFNNGGTIRL